MATKRIQMALLGAVLSLPITVQASGSYSARPPRPPMQRVERGQTDQDKYALGKKIYAGKANLTAVPAADAAKQSARLKELAAQLPKSAKGEAKLTPLAGKLTPEQMAALEYYLQKRYKLN